MYLRECVKIACEYIHIYIRNIYTQMYIICVFIYIYLYNKHSVYFGSIVIIIVV